MSEIWFTSDLHMGHTNIARLRGLEVGDHDDYVAYRWDKVVRDIDQVWVLGDVSMSDTRTVARALEWISDRPGIKHLIAGNHDSCHPMHREAHKWQREYLKVFESVQSAAVRKIGGHRVRLSHFPYLVDHTAEVRYPEWRFPNDGAWLLHGHTHSSEKFTSSREIHVGVDAHGFGPVSLNWVEDVIKVADTAPQWFERVPDA